MRSLVAVAVVLAGLAAAQTPAARPSQQVYAPDEVQRIRERLRGPPSCSTQLGLAREVIGRHGDLPRDAFPNAANGEGAEAGDAAQVIRRCGSAEDVPKLAALANHPNDYAKLHVARALVTHGDRKTARALFRRLETSPSQYYADRGRFEGWLLDARCEGKPEGVWADWRQGVAEAAFVPPCLAGRLRDEQKTKAPKKP